MQPVSRIETISARHQAIILEVADNHERRVRQAYADIERRQAAFRSANETRAAAHWHQHVATTEGAGEVASLASQVDGAGWLLMSDELRTELKSTI